MNNLAIEIKHVYKSFKSVPLFKDINLNCKKGEIVGIIGANGVGKSVLFKIIAGLIMPDKGEVFVYGKDIVLDRSIPHHLGALIEEPGFIPSYSGLDNLKFLASIRNEISESEILNVLEMVGLLEDKNKKVKYYSLGMKKKLGIAQAIMENPELLLLDEPMNALDKRSIEQMRSIFLKLANEKKVTILLASHNEKDIYSLCDTIYLIEDGGCAKVEQAKYLIK